MTFQTSCMQVPCDQHKNKQTSPGVSKPNQKATSPKAKNVRQLRLRKLLQDDTMQSDLVGRLPNTAVGPPNTGGQHTMTAPFSPLAFTWGKAPQGAKGEGKNGKDRENNS